MTYLDYQATTPLDRHMLDAMLPWLRDHHGNPHSPHREGRRAKAAVELARDRVAALCPPGGRVVFTSGATEALNWAIKGTAGPIVTLATEHAAVLDTVAAEARHRETTILPVDPDGLADPQSVTRIGSVLASPEHIPPRRRPGPSHDALENVDQDVVQLDPGLRRGGIHGQKGQVSIKSRATNIDGIAGGLVAAMLVNNEIGVVQPIATLADRAHAAGALFLCDAVQGYGRVPIPPTVDLVAISAHKIYGPKGIGALWIRDGVTLTPLLHGGDQEGGRSGTLSPALCAGFGVAAALMVECAEEDAALVERLWTLATERLSGWTINGSVDARYHGNLNVYRPGLDVARLMSDCRDLAFSAGSACASGSGRPSHVLRATGLSDAQARSSIRLGWGRGTDEAAFAIALDRIVAAADAQ